MLPLLISCRHIHGRPAGRPPPLLTTELPPMALLHLVQHNLMMMMPTLRLVPMLFPVSVYVYKQSTW
jgi:hypothetical protein